MLYDNKKWKLMIYLSSEQLHIITPVGGKNEWVVELFT